VSLLFADRRAALERARERYRYCERQRRNFESSSEATPANERTLRKLINDERKAASDLWHASGEI
jgi:hypothetical protein